MKAPDPLNFYITSMMRKRLLPAFLILALASCVPQHKVVYVQSPASGIDYAYPIERTKNLKIEPFDMLYISVSSSNGEQNNSNFFNLDKQNYNSITEQTLSLLSYTVNDSGMVRFPVIGKLKLQGLTLDEAAGLIRDSTQGVISHPIVSVRFVNNAVTVLGEVGKAGTYSYTNERLTVFFALGLAGDITEYGNRKKVVLIRECQHVIHKYILDLTRDDIFRSEYYYLRPNDIVYVEPLKIRRFGMKEYPFA
ncbi:MAG TPA: polysaccharide biosynthesis/export family protein, partial [Bacteroidia bacterium]|nr:polysaccharide biosynthesis/export family protein [Bacteroidia bacterium]